MKFLNRRKAGTEVAQIEPQQLAAQVNDPTGLVHIFYQLCANPDMPVAKMEQAVKLHERMFKQQAELEFNRAMNRVQKQIEPVQKDAWNDQTKSHYAKLEKVANAAQPVALEEGFSISFSEADSPKPDHVRCVMIVRHIAGHSEKHFRDFHWDHLGIQGKPNKTLTHGQASAFSYGMRYLTCQVFAVTLVSKIAKDDDGNAAGGMVRRKDTITGAQANILQKLIDDTGTKLDSFLGFAEIEKLEDLPAARFAECKDMLERRKAHLEQKRAAGSAQ